MVRDKANYDPITEEDYERWAEAIDSPQIETEEDYISAWDEYFEEEDHLRQDMGYRNMTKRIIERDKVLETTFTVRARVRGRETQARQTFVTVRGKRQSRLRDKLGRFAKKEA